MALIRQAVCVVLLAAGALAAASPNVILITVDTTRADRMGFLGSTLGLTPNLDKLASQSVVFTRAYAQAPLTAPSHATILTGTYPQFHQVNNFGVPLRKDLPFAPAILKAHGYRTAAFVGALVLDPVAGAVPGFDRGFDTYNAGFHKSGREDRYHSVERRAGDVVARALAWLSLHPRGPFFLWVHLYDAHDPYDPPEPFKSKYASAPYDGEIAYADSAVGRFMTQLRARGLYDSAMIAVMADHGEGLADHGEDTHGILLYDETINVPLVIKLPGKASASKRVQSRVGLVDVLPTILDVVGVAVPREVQGQSLIGMMKPASHESEAAVAAPSLPERSSYAESDYAHDAYGWSSLRALRTGKYLYIKAPRQELYDQSADPEAAHDLSSTSTAVTSTLAGQLDAFRQKTVSTQEAPKSVVDPAMREKLAALGYVASGSNDPKGSSEEGADPKDKVEIGNMIHRVNLLLEDNRCPAAVPILQQAIAKEPGMVLLYSKLSQCLLFMKDYPQALPVLRKIAELGPDSTDAHFQLGRTLLIVKDFAAAVPELEKVVAKVPKGEQAHILLATAYVGMQRWPEGINECNKVLEVTPDDYEANLLLGRTLLLSGDAAAALPKLMKAAKLQPKIPVPHLALSNAYVKLGRFDDAAREQFEAKQLGADP
jgi:arylsulfatase A-like enzyme/Flp pilus assembly protein TadD